MRILIIRPGALGDTLMLLPSLARIGRLAEITLVAREPGLEYLRPHVPRAMDYERTGWHRLFMDDPLSSSTLPFSDIDLAVAFLSDREGNVAERLQVSMPRASIHVFPGFPNSDESIHTAFYLAKCLALSGCPLDPKKALEDALQHPLLGEDPFPKSPGRIVFHLGSGGITKNHPTDFWMTLLQAFKYRFSADHNPFVILLGPAEEIYLSFYQQQLNDDREKIIFSPEKEPLTRLLQRAPLYIGHDSGITHLAAMLGTPTIALFRNSRVDQWRPLGPRVKVIEEKESSLTLIDQVCKAAREFIG